MILIYINNLTNRTKYTFDFVFNEIGIDYETTSDFIYFKKQQGAKINYSNISSYNCIHIIPHGLLSQKNIFKQEINIENEPVKYFFKTNGDFPFDVFSAIFYLISRYEEYLPHEKDEHGRYLAKNSIAYKYNFLNKPIVNIWIKQLKQFIKNKFPTIVFKENNYKYIPTIDVDVAYYSILKKGLFRALLSLGKKVIKCNWKELILQFQIITKLEADPFDTYDFIFKLHSNYNLKTLFFITVGSYGKFDKNIQDNKKAFKKLLEKIKPNGEICIHPSYNSNKKKRKLKKEIQLLSNLSGKTIFKSRQHYLKLSLPKTYQNLINAGIFEDYTMGYREETGFRAGTCSPFYFYNLPKEEITNLKIYPFAFMDGTLINKYNISEAFEIVKNIVSEVKNVNGNLITIWHNSSLGELNEWKGWRDFYKDVIKICSL